jgi:NADH-quinone oxidoreductase subunit D
MAMSHDHGHAHAPAPTGPVPTVVRPWVNPYLDIAEYDPEGDLLVLNLGPQHPSTHGVFRVKLWLDGEVCIKAVPYAGYLHRGVEKLCEKLTYVMITPVVDKNDYLSAFTNELAINMAFEALNQVEPPRRSQYLRTLGAEMQRVASHLLWLGTFGLDMGGAIGGGSTLFLHTLREREGILDCFETWTGGRFHYNTLTVGGNRHDLPAGFADLVKRTFIGIEQRIAEYDAMILNNAIFRARTTGVGRLDADLALEHGITGPNLRASGIDMDLRRDRPYAAYGELDLKVAVQSGGDCLARYFVRMAEMRESIRLVLLLIDGIPEGPITALKPVKLPGAYKGKAGQAYVSIDTARGELGTWVIADGSDKPYRCKIRAPSYHAVSLIPYLAPGNNVSDIVVTLGSFDPVLGEVDR